MPDYAVSAALRDAVVAKLNASGSLPAGVTAVAIYDEVADLESLEGGRVVVKPASKDNGLLTRGGPGRQTYEVAVHVAVQFKLSASQPLVASADPWLALAERLAAPVANGGVLLNDPAGLPTVGAICTRSRFPRGLFIDEHIQQFQVFTSVVELTFVVRR